MYIRIVEKPTEKMESLGCYNEDIDIDTNDLLQVYRKVDEVWRRATKIDKNEATYCMYGEKNLPLVRGSIHAKGDHLVSLEIVPVCAACGQDLKTHGQFVRVFGSIESEESRRKIYYACMDESCDEYGVNREMRAVVSA